MPKLSLSRYFPERVCTVIYGVGYSLLLFTLDNNYSYNLVKYNPVFHAGVKGVSERKELTPCIILLIYAGG